MPNALKPMNCVMTTATSAREAVKFRSVDGERNHGKTTQGTLGSPGVTCSSPPSAAAAPSVVVCSVVVASVVVAAVVASAVASVVAATGVASAAVAASVVVCSPVVAAAAPIPLLQPAST